MIYLILLTLTGLETLLLKSTDGDRLLKTSSSIIKIKKNSEGSRMRVQEFQVLTYVSIRLLISKDTLTLMINASEKDSGEKTLCTSGSSLKKTST